MKKTVLIMAGGLGERFWPKSRKSLPKQFLSFTDDRKTMIQLTVERARHMADLEDIYIVTNIGWRHLVAEQLPEIPEANILCEPIGRNTAPCIGLGAVHLAYKYGDALMIVLPSDHLIKNNEMFLHVLGEGCQIAEEDSRLVTIGIAPNYPETGYGYMRFNSNETIGNSYAVERFIEKPDIEKAEEYLKSGRYLWNSGVFVWKVSTILNNFKKFLPEISMCLTKIHAAAGTADQTAVLEKLYPQIEPVSIDYGIMEKADGVYILPGTFGWDDVGSWLAVERMKESDESGNAVTGNIIMVNCKNNIIQGSQKLIAAVGLSDLVIVDTKDATLICNKNNVADIKLVLEKLRACSRDEYL